MLQAALRESNESFADRLGVSPRAVAAWHEKPTLKPRPEVQQILDRTLENASDAERNRFATILATDSGASRQSTDSSTPIHALRVAIAIVLKGSQVLIVQRRSEDSSGISWQFPAGMVKPGASSEIVAVRETLAETGIHCAVVRNLGSRLHPTTHVYCDYLLCEYLGGDAQNLDVVENVSVTWTTSDRLTRFIPIDLIFSPVLDAIEELAHDRRDT
ncbi:NUDIX hydrolase [Saccharothrix saharensis]|uniref:NUDIX hydrolase n=1 Tax=Saccharothrix saharensis TaxID=571190 RepID=UPI001B8811EF|nr:NUDIX hydrolase [Saccharothrix saharensis]